LGHQRTLRSFKNAFLSRNLDQNMPKNALLFRKKFVKILEKLAHPRLALCELYRLRCHGHKSLLFSHKEEEFFLQRLRLSTAESNSPPVLSHILASTARRFWQYFFQF